MEEGGRIATAKRRQSGISECVLVKSWKRMKEKRLVILGVRVWARRREMSKGRQRNEGVMAKMMKKKTKPRMVKES